MSTPEPAPTVLVIEPDATTADLYRRELSRRFRVLTSPSARRAAGYLAVEDVRAVVLEPLGAEADLEALRSALADPTAPHPRALIVCSVLDDRRWSEMLGAACHLVKPVLPMTLLEVVLQACASPTDPASCLRE